MGRRNTTPKEGIEAAEAFAAYVALGPKRSLDKLATLRVDRGLAKTHHSALIVVKRWSSAHGWQIRLVNAVNARTQSLLEEAAEIDSETFTITSRLLNERAKQTTPLFADLLLQIRAGVKPATPNAVNVNLKHSGSVNHNHRDLSMFTDDQIERMATISEEIAAGARSG